MGYSGKLAEREKAREMRAEGRTLADIADTLGVSKSSVSLWVRDMGVVVEQRRGGWWTNGGEHPQQRARRLEIEQLDREGVARVGDLSPQAFLVAGGALYAGEGGKTDRCVSFANTNADMMRFFMAWLRTFFDIDEKRLRVYLYLHQGLNLEAAKEFWSRTLQIPVEQFGKPYRAEPDPSIRRSKHPMGCPSVDYSCSRTHRAVMGIVRALLSWPTAAIRGGEIGITGDC